MTCPACGTELTRCPVDFCGYPAYFQCDCGRMGECVHVTAQRMEEIALQESIAGWIPYLREMGPI